MSEDEELLHGDKHIKLNILFKRISKYLKPEIKKLIVVLLLILINVGMDIIAPLFIREITNNLASENIKYKIIIVFSSLYFVLGVFNQLILYILSMILQNAGQRIIYNLRCDVYKHIINMSQNQFDDMPVGSLVTRVASYTASMSDLFTDVLVKILKNFLTIIGVYSVMLYISPKLAFSMLGLVLIVVVASIIFSKIVGIVFRNERKNISNLNSYLNENISGMKITQIFNQEEYKEKEFNVINENLRKARYKIILTFGIYRPFVTFIYVISIALTFYLGIKYGLNSGEIVAFYMYLSHFYNPIENLADQLNNVEKALTASERLFNLLDVKPRVMDKDGAVDISSFKGEIEFRNVWFAYSGEDWILKDVSFKINPHETVAFVGATGAGKTTILALIVRNYEIQKGQILIDGIDITNIKIDSLRSKIGQMLQDVFLFSGTIKSNITLNDDSYCDEDIYKVIDYVNARGLIETRENGLYEEVNARGENFSQGERQLISFARTVLQKPQILILDEATANIDTETELVIQKSLENIKSIGTMLIVAHRLSTIQHADKIIVLANGEIIESGNHQELLDNKGFYYKLYKLQFEK